MGQAIFIAATVLFHYNPELSINYHGIVFEFKQKNGEKKNMLFVLIVIDHHMHHAFKKKL